MRRRWIVVSGVVAAVAVSTATPAGATEATWTSTTVPAPRHQLGALTAVSCSSPSSCLAVGYGVADQSGARPALVARWDGTSWSAVPLPRSAATLTFSAVSCPDATGCLLVSDTGAVALRYTATGWRTLPAPRSTATFGGLSALDCVTRTDCTAVGSQAVDDAPRLKPLILHWDGASWTEAVVSPAPTQDTRISDVACASATTCFAVGLSGERQVLLTGSRGRWRSTPPPGDSLRGSLDGVACGGPGMCVAVGRHFPDRGESGPVSAVVIGWDGSTWSVRSSPDPGLPNGTSQLQHVACASPTSCVATGAEYLTGVRFGVRYAQRFDGTTWTVSSFAPAPTTPYLPSDLDCAGTLCMTVGRHDEPFPDGSTSMAQIADGTGWRIVPTPDVTQSFGVRLAQISCSSDDACTAVASYPASTSLAYPLAAFARWNGARWATTPLPDLPLVPDLVSCGSPGRCLLVQSASPTDGISDAAPEGAVLTGDVATRAPLVVPPDADGAELAVTGLSCGAPGSCLAIGAEFDRSVFARNFVERWTPSGWRPLAAPPVPAGRVIRLAAVSCVSATWCLAVGTETLPSGVDGGYASVWNGSGWRRAAPPSPLRFPPTTRVSCASSTRCAAIGSATGDAGGVLMWDGTTWTAPASPAAGQTLRDVSCGSPTACTAVGSTSASVPYAQQWDGSAWTAVGAPPAPVTSVSCHAVCRAVGPSATVSSRSAVG